MNFLEETKARLDAIKHLEKDDNLNDLLKENGWKWDGWFVCTPNTNKKIAITYFVAFKKTLIEDIVDCGLEEAEKKFIHLLGPWAHPMPFEERNKHEKNKMVSGKRCVS